MTILQPEYLEVPDNITLGFSTRGGGVSPAPFHSLNMSISRGDSLENVSTNRSRFLSNWGIKPSQLAQGNQISEDGLAVVSSPGVYDACDALICSTPQIFLSVLTADCAPILIWSTERDVVASVHSGWQGSEMDILGRTIDRLVEDFQVPAASLCIVIGPGLSQENFEVGPEFSTKFPQDYLQEFGEDRYKFDNNRYLGDKAIACGVPGSQIEILNYCTCADEALFFSHRRDRNTTGRMMSIIGISA